MSGERRQQAPVIVSREAVLVTPFFKVIGKRLQGEPGSHPYYSLDLLDYVSIVPTTRDGSLVLVRQFRPAVEAMTIELPAGHVEAGQAPEEAARVELLEETGCVAETLRLVGCLRPDTGRLGNRMWVYFAAAVETVPAWQPEPGIEVVVAPSADVRRWVTDGTFDHALHVASLLLAAQAGHLTL